MIRQALTGGFLLGNLLFAASAHSAVINLGVTINDLAIPTNYSFSFLTPVATLTGPVAWTADISGLLIDGGRDGVSMSPFPGPSIFEFLIDDVVVGTDLLGVITSDFADSYSGFYDCGAGCSSLAVKIQFASSGGNDVYSQILSRFEVEEIDLSVPEPETAALFALALAGLAFARRARS